MLALRSAMGLAILLVVVRPALAIRPDSPAVKERVERAVRYLETAQAQGIGQKALVGLTLAKFGRDDTDPRIAEAAKELRELLKNGGERFPGDIYSTGISIMFLVAVDPSQYRVEIERLVESLHYRQKQHGAWGYPLESTQGGTCDTSMTQYAVLGLWEAEDQAGVTTSPVIWDRVADWIIRTQDPSGGWGYQGNPSGKLGEPTKQGGVKHSLCAAALGSLYIVRDRVAIRKLKNQAPPDLPAALKPVISVEERKAAVATKIDVRLFNRALGSGNRWMEQHYQIDKIDKEKDFWHYSLYALERYETLKEAEDGDGRDRFKNEQASWYSRGARVLIQTQNSDGSWKSAAGLVPDTCFATLFLIGSTKKSLERASLAKFHASLMRGGRGIPAAKRLRVRDGVVVEQPLGGSLDEMFQVLADEQHASYAAAREALADLAEHGDVDVLARYSASLAERARLAAPDVRRLAIQALARARDLDYAPVLIQLIRDPDPAIVKACGAALGQLSRQFTDQDLGSRPTDEGREAAIARWKEWYARVRPGVDVDSFERR